MKDSVIERLKKEDENHSLFIEAIDNLIFHPVIYFLIIILIPMWIMILIIENSSIKGINYYLLFLFPTGWVIFTTILYGLKK